jgi:hypothetical protein
MRGLKCVLACVVVLPLLSMPATAQVTTSSQFVTTAEVACTVVKSTEALSVPPDAVCGCRTPTANGPAVCARPDEELSRLLDHDTTDHLVGYLKRLTVLAVTKLPPAQRAYVRFIWPAIDAEGNLVARVVLYRYGSDSPVGDTLPGILEGASRPLTERGYYDILVTFDRVGTSSNDELPTLASLYFSKKESGPASETTLLGRLGIVEAAAAAEGLGFFREKAMKPVDVGPRGSPAMPRTVLKMYAPTVPERRANISVRDWIFTPPTSARLKEASQDLADDLISSSGRVSTCAANLAAAYAEAVSDTSSETPVPSVFSPQAERFRDRLNDALDATHDALLQDTAKCPKDTGSIGSDPVGKVDTAFRDLVKGLGTNVAPGDTQLHNVPREHVSFGFLSAARFGAAPNEVLRVKLADDGTVVEDPLPRLLNAVIVNWHPFGYHSDELVTFRDRGSVKFLTGALLSPDFGLLLGGGYSPLKGLSVNLGYAMLIVNSPKEGVVVHELPPENLRNDPFKSAWARTWFWGLSYSFQ